MNDTKLNGNFTRVVATGVILLMRTEHWRGEGTKNAGILKLNASAVTFCRPFRICDLLASKKGCRPIKGQNQLGDLLVSF